MIVTVRTIAAVTAQEAGVPIADLRGGARTKRLSRVRHLAAWVVRRATRFSTTAIARGLGYAEHSVALYAIRRTEKRLAADPELAEIRDRVLARIEALRAAPGPAAANPRTWTASRRPKAEPLVEQRGDKRGDKRAEETRGGRRLRIRSLVPPTPPRRRIRVVPPADPAACVFYTGLQNEYGDQREYLKAQDEAFARRMAEAHPEMVRTPRTAGEAA
jgi:hypothetical protein